MPYRKLWIVLLVGTILLGATSYVRVRKAIVAGTWYPANPQQLFQAAREYSRKAVDYDAPGKMIACVVPHAMWSVVGPISGAAYKHVHESEYDRVIVLSASHYASFRGGSIASVQFYKTPLGDVPLDLTAIKHITWSTLIQTRSVSYNQSLYTSGARQPVHEREQAIETQLPFLQAQNGTFLLVPILMGSLNDYQGNIDPEAIESVAETLREFINDRTLIVVATHFTHYGYDYGFHPFEKDVKNNVHKLDLEAMRYILDCDLQGFLNFLKRTKDPIDGAVPLAILTQLIPTRAHGELLRYTTSGDISGDYTDSISFASLAFFDPTLPIGTPKEHEVDKSKAPPAQFEKKKKPGKAQPNS